MGHGQLYLHEDSITGGYSPDGSPNVNVNISSQRWKKIV